MAVSLASVRSEQCLGIRAINDGAMACPFCGENLLHKQDGQLRCCRCNRVRQDLTSADALARLRRRAPILLAVLMVLPLAFGIATLDRMRSADRQPGAPEPVSQD